MKNQKASIIINGIPDSVVLDAAKDIRKVVKYAGVKLDIQHPEPPEPPALKGIVPEKLWEKLTAAFINIEDTANATPEFGYDEHGDEGLVRRREGYFPNPP